MKFNKHGVVILYKEPGLLGFGRRGLFIDEMSTLNDDQHQEIVNALRTARHINQRITIIGDAHMGKSSFIGTPTPAVIRQMEFNRNNNKF